MRNQRKWIVLVASLATAAVVAPSVVVIYHSPEYSWSSSIRDHDGDGYPDARDAFPHDASRWQLDTPHLNVLGPVGFGGGFKFELTSPTAEVAWTNVTVQLTDGFNATSWANITTESLTSLEPPTTWHCDNAQTFGDLLIFMNVTDLAANGRANCGDFVTLWIANAKAFPVNRTYTLALLYEPTGDLIAVCCFDYTTPTMEILRWTTVAGGWKVEFKAPNSQIQWSDVIIELSCNETTIGWWNMTVEDLSSSSPPAIWHYGISTPIGSLNVFLNATDLGGDGMIGEGDFITMTTMRGELPSHGSYVLALVDKLNGGIMCSIKFWA